MVPICRIFSALFGSHAAAAAFAEDRRAHAKGLEQLVERARRAGAVRAEVTAEDVRVGLMAIASFLALRPEGAASSMIKRASRTTRARGQSSVSVGHEGLLLTERFLDSSTPQPEAFTNHEHSHRVVTQPQPTCLGSTPNSPAAALLHTPDTGW
jgi:hypothetical protein